MNADDVRALYDEPPGTKVPRFTLFIRECVGVLLGEIDHLKGQLSTAYDRVAAQSELLSKRAEGKGGIEQP